jgi:hypothetical protein
MKRLKGGKPRRYKDHRRLEARPYNAAFAAIAERYRPPDRMACMVAGMVADLFVAYDKLAQSQRPTKRTASAKRKTAGLILGALRALGGESPANGHAGPPSIAELVAARKRSAG